MWRDEEEVGGILQADGFVEWEVFIPRRNPPGKNNRIKFARILWGTPKLRETWNRVSIGDRWDQAKVEAHLRNHAFDLSKPYDYRHISGQYVYMQDQRAGG